MSVAELSEALTEVSEPAACEGTIAVDERVAIMLPDGDVGAADDPGFVDWLVEHGEPAPFGKGKETRVDPNVRNAVRLVARGEARVTGFDLASLLRDVGRVLAPSELLEAKLTDVLVYPPGGHFDQHKDTPSPGLIGTLIVGLPIEHAGGEFRIEDGYEPRAIDWSGAVDPTELRWVALFSDVDHNVERVESGARVTLVYALRVADRPHATVDAGRYGRLRDVARRLDIPASGPVMIACTRHVIGLDDAEQGLDTLRGADREIADVLVSAGLQVRVRTCLVARDRECGSGTSTFHEKGELMFARLRRPLTDGDVAALLEELSFVQPWGDDGGGSTLDEVEDLAEHVDVAPVANWVIRPSAGATLLREIMFFDDGWIGNGGCEAYLYKLAALEVTRT